MGPPASSGQAVQRDSQVAKSRLGAPGAAYPPLATKKPKAGASAGRFLRYANCMELIFEVREAEEGGYVARALGQAIFTEAETWQELRDNVLEVTSLHFEDAAESPKLIQLHFVKDELIAVAAA
jgi:predicted RNase H-like HicB family nuclease